MKKIMFICLLLLVGCSNQNSGDYDTLEIIEGMGESINELEDEIVDLQNENEDLLYRLQDAESRIDKIEIYLDMY